MRRVIQVYQKLNPDKFVHNALPITVGFHYSNERSGSQWTFNAPLNITADKYLDKFYNTKEMYWDLSQLVIGAKPKTFRMYKNYITETGDIITKTTIKNYPISLPEELGSIFDDIFIIRKTLPEYRYSYKYLGWTWRIYSKYYKKHFTFTFPDDSEKYLDHYKKFKHIIEGYKIRKKE